MVYPFETCISACQWALAARIRGYVTLIRHIDKKAENPHGFGKKNN